LGIAQDAKTPFSSRKSNEADCHRVFETTKDAAATTSPHSPDWFGRFSKISIASICCERHWRCFDCLEFRQRDWRLRPHRKLALTHGIFWPLVIRKPRIEVSQLASAVHSVNPI